MEYKYVLQKVLNFLIGIAFLKGEETRLEHLTKENIQNLMCTWKVVQHP